MSAVLTATAAEVGDPLTHALELLVERAAERAAALVLADLRKESEPSSPWLYGAAGLAAYLGAPVSTMEKLAPQLPHRRLGARLVFRRDEIDAWLDGQEGRRWRP